jgi:hypothetical protein
MKITNGHLLGTYTLPNPTIPLTPHTPIPPLHPPPPSSPGHDDEAEFDVLVSAMKTLGFSTSEQRQIFGIVATVLHLGQIEFQESTDGGDGSKVSTGRRGSVSGGRRRSSTVSSGDASSMGLKKAAEIMGVGEDKLGEALTHRTVMNVLADLDVKAAKSARDALAKVRREGELGEDGGHGRDSNMLKGTRGMEVESAQTTFAILTHY